MTKRQRRKIGDIVKIPINNGQHSYGRVLASPLFGFYDLFTSEDLDSDEIISSRIIFILSVADAAVTMGHWTVVGNQPLEPELQKSVRFFMQDIISGELSIYVDGDIYPATYEECVGLECCAVWSAGHVEDRIRDYFNGVPNKWVTSLELKVLN